MVTLGIIGVVSAMTVPTLMQNYQRKSYVTQLHKVYNELSQAAVQYMTDNNAINMKEAGFTSQDGANKFIEHYFKVVNNCSTDQFPCFSEMSDYKKLSGVTITTWGGCVSTRAHYSIASGASIGICYRAIGNNIISEIFVDVNGQKGPNIVGRDLFNLFLYNNGELDDISDGSIIPPISEENRDDLFSTICEGNNAAQWHGCFGKILNDNWEMTY